MLFAFVAMIMFWWAYALFTSSDCTLSGVKLAVVIAPVCLLLGASAASTIPLTFGLVAVWLAFSYGASPREPRRKP